MGGEQVRRKASEGARRRAETGVVEQKGLKDVDDACGFRVSSGASAVARGHQGIPLFGSGRITVRRTKHDRASAGARDSDVQKARRWRAYVLEQRAELGARASPLQVRGQRASRCVLYPVTNLCFEPGLEPEAERRRGSTRAATSTFRKPFQFGGGGLGYPNVPRLDRRGPAGVDPKKLFVGKKQLLDSARRHRRHPGRPVVQRRRRRGTPRATACCRAAAPGRRAWGEGPRRWPPSRPMKSRGLRRGHGRVAWSVVAKHELPRLDREGLT